MDGFAIPIGADFSAMQQAIDQIIAAMDRMGNQIAASFEKSDASAIRAAHAMAQVQRGTTTVANSANVSGAAIASLSSKFIHAVSVAGTLGNAASGIVMGLNALNKASTALTGMNLAAKIGTWVQAAGGLRGALTAIPNVMRAIASNRTFQIVAAGAVTAYAAVLTIRTAFRIASASVNLLKTASASVFHGMVAAAKSAANAVRSAFNGIASLPGKILGAIPGLPIAGFLSAAGAIGLAFASIDKAANMETLKTAFAPLLGGAAAAKARIEELSRFAAVTPFELPEIASASRTLQTLTRGALATGKGLTLVGDVASGVNGNFEEIAVTIGRLYDGLQSGRPAGEAMQRLQELGAISGETRGKIEDLQKEGSKGPEVWKIAEMALSKFSGSMERQSVTWKGKLSTLYDSISMTMAKFAEPIIDSLKPWIDMATSYVDSLQSKIAGIGASIGNTFNAAMAIWQTDNLAAIIGAGLTLGIIDAINAFSSGIRSTIAYLGAAMTSIMQAAKDSWGVQEFLGILEDVGKGLAAMITTAILKAIDAIPGIDTTQDTNRSENEGKNSLNRAKNRLQDFDGGDAAQKGIDALKAANKAGNDAAAKAGGKPVIDSTKAAIAWDKVFAPIQEQMRKNSEGIAKANADLDAKLTKPIAPGDDTTSTKDKIEKATAPAVLSLTRIGGGGFANNVINNQLTEARKQTGLLQKIAQSLVAVNPGTPMKATYV